MLPRILDAPAERQLAEARAVLGAAVDALARFGATDPDRAALAASVRQLDDFFLLVIVGEFNAGKSAVINALIGERVLEEGVTPTTSRIHLVRYGERAGRADAGGLVVTAPVELLRDVHIVDTPGTNAIQREHERLTSDFVPRSDLVLFVTSADRPFTESERVFLESIRSWGKKIVFVLNKVDLFEREDELDEVLAFMRDGSSRLLGLVPEIFPVSARLELRARQGEPELRARSRFEALERFLVETLDDEGRFRLKLANPLGVGRALAARYLAVADERLALLGEDVALLEEIERQRVVARDDVRRGFELRLTAIEKVLLEMEARGTQYFEDTLRLARVVDLLNRARIQREFEERVVADAPREIERQVTGLIDWLVDEDFRQWQAVTARLAPRQQAHADRLVGAPEVGTFHQERSGLIESVRREAQRVVETYDKERESEEIADAARAAVATAAAAGAGAVGLGTLVTLAATTAAADVTGLAAAGLLATIGLLVLPARRRKARADLAAKVAALREQLVSTLRTEFARAQDRSASRLDSAMAPYSRFVRAEQARWQEARQTFTGLGDRLENLTGTIGARGL
jgi:small GTP-binding protein